MRVKAIVLAVIPLVVLVGWWNVAADLSDELTIASNVAFAIALPIIAIMSSMSLKYAMVKHYEIPAPPWSGTTNVIAKVISVISAMIVLPFALLMITGMVMGAIGSTGLLG